ncbi:hypothetical protein [Nonomuraea jabiensis]|uniref:hypothetical protein n=1 Tax=Nonomuraea jabiensis TaxID=882448 RepID=UPI003687C7DB
MEALAREDQASFDSAAAFLADRDDADRVLVEVMTRAISGLWRNRLAARRRGQDRGQAADRLARAGGGRPHRLGDAGLRAGHGG